MEIKTWKILAIIFIILTILEASYIYWGYYVYSSNLDKTNECWYDICGEYPDAYYEANVCTCYDYDIIGELVVAKTEYMK